MAFIVAPAEKAMKDRRFDVAISLWSGVLAIRGEADDAAWRLAEAWTLAGEFDDAMETLERYEGAVTDAAKKEKAQKEIASLKTRPRGFSNKPYKVASAKKEAEQAFKLGRAAFKKKEYEHAALYYRAGIEMAPEVVGNVRELGESLDKLGRTKEANEYFQRYLRRRPFGKNADVVRKRLVAAKLTGKLSVTSALPCDEVWINGQQVPKKLPITDHVVAPGRYKMLCFSSQYHIAHYEEVTVAVGQTGTLAFAWAVLENQLVPWGRVVIEDPKNPSQMLDVGLWPEVGVPVPADRRALKIIMTAGDGSQKKQELIKLEPGKRYVLKW